MAMALEVVDLLPWQWDLRTDEITYSSYKPIEQGKKEVSEMTYTTDINDYLTFVCEEDRERIRQVFKNIASIVQVNHMIRKTGWKHVLLLNNMMKRETP